MTAAPSTSKRSAEGDAEPAAAAKQAKGAEAEVAAEVEASALAGGSEPAPVTTVNGEEAKPTPAEPTAHALNGATADAGTGAPEATPAGDASADAAPSGSGAASTAVVATGADADELAADSDEELVNDGDEGGNMVLAQYEKARTSLLRLRSQLTLREWQSQISMSVHEDFFVPCCDLWPHVIALRRCAGAAESEQVEVHAQAGYCAHRRARVRVRQSDWRLCVLN